MKEATEFIDDMEMEVEVDKIPEGVDEVDLDEIKSVESFFNDVIRNESFWNAGGRLLTSKVRSFYRLQNLQLSLMNRSQQKNYKCW